MVEDLQLKGFVWGGPRSGGNTSRTFSTWMGSYRVFRSIYGSGPLGRLADLHNAVDAVIFDIDGVLEYRRQVYPGATWN